MKKIFLTFDMDWASDEVLRDFYDLICELDVCGTIHVTHSTNLLDIFQRDGKLELGIHPNYNMLLDGGEEGRSYEEVISDIHEIVPNAVTVRSHSLTTSSRIEFKCKEYGLKYDLNMLYPPQNGDCIRCYKNVSGLYKIPFIYEDDIWLMSGEKKSASYYLSDDFLAPRVFNFHPIHIFLNSESIDRYEKARSSFNNYNELLRFKNINEFGIKDYFLELVKISRQKGYVFSKIKDGEW